MYLNLVFKFTKFQGINVINVFLPDLKTFVTTHLDSDIILEIVHYKDSIQGINLYEDGTVNGEYIFKGIKILEQSIINEVPIESQNSEFATKNEEKTDKKPFLRQYWWLIAVFLLLYSIITVNPNSTESPESNSNEQLQSSVNHKKYKKRE
ncbi:hypothetical protein RS030_2239 [Cryptosporidium xiaoi]|uniref:Uncharacterized protein n=1 Tax=Cryptosporidium xiaoi TaxID=659607 RepID=A0AAV9XY26_9CRYT